MPVTSGENAAVRHSRPPYSQTRLAIGAEPLRLAPLARAIRWIRCALPRGESVVIFLVGLNWRPPSVRARVACGGRFGVCVLPHGVAAVAVFLMRWGDESCLGAFCSPFTEKE